MSHRRPAPSPTSKRLKALLSLYVLAALCLAQASGAQSGRRGVKKGSPVPPPAAQTGKPAGRITSVVIGGHDISTELREKWSTSVSTVVKSFTTRLGERPAPLLGVVNGGKMTREEAHARARRETGAYVLWFGYSMRMVGLFDTTVEHMDYVVLMPQTAEVVTEGRVYPGVQRKTVDPGGVLRVPTSPRRRRVVDVDDLLEDGGRQIADRVRNRL